MTARLLLAAALGLLAAAPNGHADSGLAIEVKDGQLLTVQGQTNSLATLLADVCAKAGVAFRGFEAGDRPITISYVDVPLRDALQRMLRDETYMIGVRAAADNKNVAVAWVHITGSKSGAAPGSPVAVPPPLAVTPEPPKPQVPASMTDFGLPDDLLARALSSQDAAERREATRLLAEHVEANPGLVDQFLQREMGATAEELAGYDFAKETLQTLAIRQKNPVSRAKLDALVKSIMVRTGGPKKPTYAELMQQGMPH
jgi:hypothetical protein